LFNHIVVPLDGSNLSEAALAYVTPLAIRLNSKVVLLYADSDPYADMFGVQGTARDEGSLPNVADYLQSVSERLQSEVFSAKLTTKSARRLQSY
jgi:nucleotide-binding universal stress UspA family protein